MEMTETERSMFAREIGSKVPVTTVTSVVSIEIRFEGTGALA
jgi:hypothetical protein